MYDFITMNYNYKGPIMAFDWFGQFWTVLDRKKRFEPSFGHCPSKTQPCLENKTMWNFLLSANRVYYNYIYHIVIIQCHIIEVPTAWSLQLWPNKCRLAPTASNTEVRAFDEWWMLTTPILIFIFITEYRSRQTKINLHWKSSRWQQEVKRIQ